MTHAAAREAVGQMLYEMACEGSSCTPWEQLGQTTRKKYRRRADRILAKLDEMGFVMLPAEATDGMIIAAIDRRTTDEDHERGSMYKAIWRAMVAELTRTPEIGA